MLVCPFLEQSGLPVPTDRAWLARAVETLRERAKTLVELAQSCASTSCDAVEPTRESGCRAPAAAIAPALRDLTERLETLSRVGCEYDRARLPQEILATHDLTLGKLAQPVRVAVTGGTASPGIFEVLDVLGRERTLARLRAALARLESPSATPLP